MRKRRPRVGDSRVNYDPRDNRGGGRPSYGGGNGGGYNRPNNNPRYNNNGGGRGGYNNNNRRPNNNYRQGNGDYNPNAKYNFQKQLKYKEVLADPNEPIRLNKFLSNAGVCSRREADEFIQAGAVKVNGEVVTELGTKITRQDNVLFNDKPVQIESKVYIVLNKPKNCVTTSDDPQERLTVMDLVKNACSERIYPVGRLDRNTTGVLLLTNDGDLASKLTHPSFKKKKIYHVWLDKNVSVEDMEKIANGMELEDGEIHADAISYASEDDKSQVGIEIHSGRNRIVRRIFESLGYHVVKLDRVYFAGLTKKNLGRGKWRYLNEREVNALRMGAFE
jgi:23S rRNA pseudouridine2605 synthase